jgi:dinuclear metal center YbgI/SA1388 family protein
MRVADLVRAMETIAPTELAAHWDNVGLLVGDAHAEAARVLLAIDCTREVLAEAQREGCGAVVAYHPPIFQAQKRFVAGAIAFEAARAGVAVYSPHTALDVAEGGTNDVLADAVGLRDRRALQRAEVRDAEVKLVTFVPAEHVERVSEAVFAAGAGRIGNYTSCSFRSTGTGTFFGEEGASPAVGRAGRLELAAEVRVETIVPLGRVDAAVQALRATHPYEEPAFDLVRLARSAGGRGFGRVGAVDPAPVRELVDRVKEALGAVHVLVAGPLDRSVSRAAVCAGSAGDLLGDVIASGAELLVTGELRHHDALRAAAAGLTAVCTLHSVSERVALGALGGRLEALLPGARVLQSKADREPFVFA